MRSHGIRILVNAIIVVALWTGFMVMSNMAKEERSAAQTSRMDAYHKANQEAAKAMLVEQAKAMGKKYHRCVSATAPFLTDHILIVGAHIGGKYDTGVVYEVTMGEAFMQPRGSIIVLAYCE